jgi:hypothetical protein
MKIEAVGTFLSRTAFSLGLALASAVSLNANAELAYGVSDAQNLLISFNTTSPTNILSAHSISGLQSGEQIRGIDFIGNTMYGLGSGSHLYTLNPTTGAATQVGSGQFSPLLNGINFGFNAAGNVFYVASDSGQNLILTTFPLGAAGPNYTAGSSIDGMAYDHVTGAFYGISGVTHNWLGLNPTNGNVTVIGATGANFGQRLALDLAPTTDIAYLAATVGGQAGLYTVDKATGALTLINSIGAPGVFTSGLDALTIVPEPNSVALFAVGGALVALLFRKR